MAMFENMCASAGFSLPGGPELIVIFVIILLIFGPKQLPALSRSIGKAITDFKKGLNDIKDDIENSSDADSTTAKTAEAPKAVNDPPVKG